MDSTQSYYRYISQQGVHFFIFVLIRLGISYQGVLNMLQQGIVYWNLLQYSAMQINHHFKVRFVFSNYQNTVWKIISMLKRLFTKNRSYVSTIAPLVLSDSAIHISFTGWCFRYIKILTWLRVFKRNYIEVEWWIIYFFCFVL